MFAELIGMEELSAQIGEAKALSLLGDLITSFDEAGKTSASKRLKPSVVPIWQPADCL